MTENVNFLHAYKIDIYALCVIFREKKKAYFFSCFFEPQIFRVLLNLNTVNT